MKKSMKPLFVISHASNQRVGSKPVEKIDPADLKKITDVLDKAGALCVYLPPGIKLDVKYDYEQCEEEEDY